MPDVIVPIVVYVSGPPGSGKTTLAGLLADRLALPHLNKDRIRDGQRFTRGAGATDEGEVWEALYSTMERWLDAEVSFIVDFTNYAGTTEPELLRRIGQRALLFNVHCRSASAIERFGERRRRHPQLAMDGERDRADFAKAASATAKSEHAPELGCQRVEVDTTDSYEPVLNDIVERILRATERTLPVGRGVRA